MSRMDELKEAFDIFLKYNPNQWLEGADHDIIYGPDEIENITEEDFKKLRKLGWNIHEEYGGWYHFV